MSNLRIKPAFVSWLPKMETKIITNRKTKIIELTLDDSTTSEVQDAWLANHTEPGGNMPKVK